jgi:hypothetical protein
MLNAGKVRWVVLLCLFFILVAAAIGWRVLYEPKYQAGPSSNSIFVIAPYWYSATWVFDDPNTGLNREPFIAGVPEMINALVKDIPDAKKGFRLTFSAQPFPNYQAKLTWLRGDKTGNYYRLDNPPIEGWLCPAMFKFYTSAPKELYVKAEAKRE